LGLDFLGIGINMALSPVPFFYYSAYCDSTLFKNYLIFGIGLSLLVFILVSAFDTIKYNQYKTLRKMVTPLTGIVSIGGLAKLLIDYYLYDNYGDSYELIPGVYISLAGAFCFFCGFAFYGLRYKLLDLDSLNAVVQANTIYVEVAIKFCTFSDS
jgi:hypothetical protein